MSETSAKSSAAIAAEDLPATLHRIAALNTSELRSLWLRMTGKPPTRQLSGDLLRRMVCQHVQEQSLGKLDRRLEAMLDRLADGKGLSPARLKVGTVLVREHAGVLHQVMVVDGGFLWNDQILPSLSAVAKAMTGTTWNGIRFFGLDQASHTSGKPKRLSPARERSDPRRPAPQPADGSP